MSNLFIIIGIALGIGLIGSLMVKSIFLSLAIKHRHHQAKKLKFLQVKIPKSVTTK